jgi:hypothetical protein
MINGVKLIQRIDEMINFLFCLRFKEFSSKLQVALMKFWFYNQLQIKKNLIKHLFYTNRFYPFY